jgi:prepilin signal peptidase PulO-like enzyme (type II secretory pathway)
VLILFFTSYYFLIGTVLASFAALCGQRIGSQQCPWAPPRSYCDACHIRLRWWQLIPILGYLIQGGHCHYCRQPIPVFFPLSELLAGTAAALLCGPGLGDSAAFFIVITTLVGLASNDFFYQFIYPVGLLGLFPLFFCTHHQNWTWENMIASALLLLFLACCCLTSYLGIGDGEFLLVVTFTIGWYPTLYVIMLGSFFTLLLTLRMPIKEKIPFIPGLAAALAMVLILLKNEII